MQSEMFPVDQGVNCSSSASVSATTSSNVDCHTTYVMITPPENGGTGTTLTIQTKGELSEALEGTEMEEKEITALVVGEDDLGISNNSQQTGTPSSGTVGWSKAAVLKMIQLHKEHQHLFDDPHYKKKSVWEMVAMCMQKEGYMYSWIQVENKWKAITKKYRDTVDYNARHGHILQRKCPFYNELSTVYEYTSPYPSQSPATGQISFKSVLNNSSSSFQQKTIAMVTTQLPASLKRPLEVDSLPTSSTSTSASSSSEGIKTIIVENQLAHDEQIANRILSKKKKYTPSSSDNVSDVGQVLHMLRVLNEDRRKQEKLRMDRIEKMHQEKMAMFREFLDILKQSNSKDSVSLKNEGDISSGSGAGSAT